MIEQFWATICVPHENYIRGQRVQLPRTKRNAELAASGYLIFDPIVEEVLTPSTPPPASPRKRRTTPKFVGIVETGDPTLSENAKTIVRGDGQG